MGDQQFNAQEIKEAVRSRYAKSIQEPSSGCCGSAATQPVQIGGSCCGPTTRLTMKGGMVKLAGYGEADLESLPADAVQNSFGCGNPLAFAGVVPGQTILDIGSGAGIDCLIAAERVGPAGRVIGLDMTPEMIERARVNACEAGVSNVEFRLGEAEKMPVEDASVDWVISNCVINLSPDKPSVFREIARVLRPGGRISISDIVAEALPAPVLQSQDAWTGCIAGAMSEPAYVQGLEQAGLRGVRVSSRIVYEASQLAGLFASSSCGCGSAADAEALARVAVGKIWSARFEGVKSYPSSVAASVAIEPARSGDLPAIEALLAEGDLHLDISEHLVHFLVARREGRAVGCIGMEVYGGEALFRSLAVTPVYRGMGLAQRLYGALVERAAAQGVKRAYLLTKTIAPLAEAWGFQRFDREEAPHAIRETTEFRGSCCTSAVAMRRDLLA